MNIQKTVNIILGIGILFLILLLTLQTSALDNIKNYDNNIYQKLKNINYYFNNPHLNLKTKLIMEGEYYKLYAFWDSINEKYSPVVSTIDISWLSEANQEVILLDLYAFFDENELDKVFKHKGDCVVFEKSDIKAIFCKNTYIIPVYRKIDENNLATLGFLYMETMDTIKLKYVDHQGNTIHEGIGYVQVESPVGVAIITEECTIGIGIKEPGFIIEFKTVAWPVRGIYIICIACKISSIENKDNVSYSLGILEGEHPELARELLYGVKQEPKADILGMLIAIGLASVFLFLLYINKHKLYILKK